MIRFKADADLNDVIVGGCRRREPSIDFLPPTMPTWNPKCWLVKELVPIWGASEAEEWKNRWRALPLPYSVS
ncbi:MAG: hypothetical protein SGI92_13550 [Bryobacteraceae bacterium]|nr:hypothetical protein [Bryobacteraceae bacterium]